MIGITAVKITDSIDTVAFETLLKFVAPSKAERIRRFSKRIDAERSLIADTLARLLICRKLKIQNSQLKFCLNPYGKPLLESPPDLHFNVSHSGKWVVCCIDQTPIGVDVEEMRPVDYRIIERFFSKEEATVFFDLSEEKREEHFFDLWTLKESYVKAIGKGLFISPSSFTVKDKGWFFKQYSIDMSYKLSVCAMGYNFPNTINILDLGAFLNAALKI